MLLDTSLFNTQQYKVRIKSKVEQSREMSSTLPYTSSAFWSPTLLFYLTHRLNSRSYKYLYTLIWLFIFFLFNINYVYLYDCNNLFACNSVFHFFSSILKTFKHTYLTHSLLDMTLNYTWRWHSSSEAHKWEEYRFTVITTKSSLTWYKWPS